MVEHKMHFVYYSEVEELPYDSTSMDVLDFVGTQEEVLYALFDIANKHPGGRLVEFNVAYDEELENYKYEVTSGSFFAIRDEFLHLFDELLHAVGFLDNFAWRARLCGYCHRHD